MLPRIRKIADGRPYDAAAYDFVLRALEYTLHALPAPRHVSGQELLVGIVAFGKHEFGPMARHVLREWGVEASRDFGAIVFDLVAQGVLAKTDEDDLADFDPGLDLEAAFVREYYAVHPAFDPEAASGPELT